jgi:hypothetical protein
LRLHCWFEIYFNGYECDEDSETRDGRERDSYLEKKIEERRVIIVVKRPVCQLWVACQRADMLHQFNHLLCPEEKASEEP